MVQINWSTLCSTCMFWKSIFIDEQSTEVKKVDLVEYYRSSDHFNNLKEKLMPIISSAAVHDNTRLTSTSYATNFFWQVHVYK